MKQSEFLRAKKIFSGSDIVRKYTFKTMNTRDNCALLARANHQLSQDFANSWDKSALLAVVCPIQAANQALARDKSIHFQDCFECLSPTKNAA